MSNNIELDEKTNQENVITAKTTKKKTSGASQKYMGEATNGVIGITDSVGKKKVSAPEKNSVDSTVALYSSKNVVWEGVGKVSKGYNILTQKEAEKWLTRRHVRIATPEEIAQEYGK